MENRAFPKLKISSCDFLDRIEGRTICASCKKSRKFYCYSCYKPVIDPTSEHGRKIPRVKLPIKIDIIKHPKEVEGKSTAIHAAVLAPDDVNMYTYPSIPDYDFDKVVVIFPSEDAETLEQIVERLEQRSERQVPVEPEDEKTNKSNLADENDDDFKALKRPHASDSDCPSKRIKLHPRQAPFERVVFIDSTWYQSSKIFNDERLKRLRCIKMDEHNTKFWRSQKDPMPDSYLATIEAIYYFVREFHDQFVAVAAETADGRELAPYDHRYDDLLFYFEYFYQRMSTLHNNGRKIRAFERRENNRRSKNANETDS
ncbi:tRNA-uridine aminocarboxypropyltransferase 1-like [Tubulanus polymorphus]|uniref:tRNA-uridine aminocarboxypropyltransferase 1-like n=1 Tax=Tubulanus polymorphus TaxID=672921 RepID=UPI003DA2EBD7